MTKEQLKTALIVILLMVVVHLLSANYEQARIAGLDQKIQDTQELLLKLKMPQLIAQQWRSLGYQVKEAKPDTTANNSN